MSHLRGATGTRVLHGTNHVGLPTTVLRGGFRTASPSNPRLPPKLQTTSTSRPPASAPFQGLPLRRRRRSRDSLGTLISDRRNRVFLAPALFLSSFASCLEPPGAANPCPSSGPPDAPPRSAAACTSLSSRRPPGHPHGPVEIPTQSSVSAPAPTENSAPDSPTSDPRGCHSFLFGPRTGSPPRVEGGVHGPPCPGVSGSGALRVPPAPGPGVPRRGPSSGSASPCTAPVTGPRSRAPSAASNPRARRVHRASGAAQGHRRASLGDPGPTPRSGSSGSDRAIPRPWTPIPPERSSTKGPAPAHSTFRASRLPRGFGPEVKPEPHSSQRARRTVLGRAEAHSAGAKVGSRLWGGPAGSLPGERALFRTANPLLGGFGRAPMGVRTVPVPVAAERVDTGTPPPARPCETVRTAPRCDEGPRGAAANPLTCTRRREGAEESGGWGDAARGRGR